MKKKKYENQLRISHYKYIVLSIILFVIFYYIQMIKLLEIILKKFLIFLQKNSIIFSSILIFYICHLFVMALILKSIKSHEETIFEIEKKNKIIIALISIFFSLLLLLVLWKIYYIIIINYFIHFLLAICFKCLPFIDYFIFIKFSLNLSKIIIMKIVKRNKETNKIK